jgi:hypothetical protein
MDPETHASQNRFPLQETQYRYEYGKYDELCIAKNLLSHRNYETRSLYGTFVQFSKHCFVMQPFLNPQYCGSSPEFRETYFPGINSKE